MDSPTEVAPAPDAVPPPGPRRLRRRPDDGPVGGVCAGVAEYFNLDPLIVRIAAVVLLVSGPGIFAYVLAWVFVPPVSGPAVFGGAQGSIDHKDRATQVFGIVLIVLAVSVFWGDWWSPARHWVLPLGLMALGAWLLLRRGDDDESPSVPATPVPPSPSTPTAPPAAWAGGTASGDVTAPITGDLDDSPDDPSKGEATVVDVIDDNAPDPTAEGLPLAGEDDGGGGGEPPTAPWDAPPLPQPPSEPAAPPLPPARGRRRVLRPIVFGALLIWAGLAVLVGVTLEAGLAGGLLIIGLGFVLGAFVGGSRALFLPAVLVGAALAVTAVIDIPLEGPVGQQRWAPTRLAELDDPYEVSVGEGTLDLQALDLPAGDEVEVAASVGVGHLIVLVPDALAVDVTADIGAGESDVFGLQQNGVGVKARQSATGDGTGGRLVLSVEVGVGQVEVRQVRGGTTTVETTPTTALG